MRTILVGDCAPERLFSLNDPDAPTETEFESAVAKVLACMYPHYQCVVFDGTFAHEEATDGVDALRRYFRPDLALIARDYSHWFIIAVALISHSFADHVLPQVKAFRYGDPQPDCASGLARVLVAAPEQIDALISSVPSTVAVVANKRDSHWESDLGAHDIQLLGVSIFQSPTGVVAVEVDGSLHAAREHLGFGAYSAPDRSLRFSPIIRLPIGKIQFDDPTGALSWWTVVHGPDAVWVTKDVGTPDIPHGALMQVVRTSDGRHVLLRALEVDARSSGRRHGGRTEQSLAARGAKPVTGRTARQIARPKKPSPTIGVITALPKEFVAMKRMLDDPQAYTAEGRGAGRQYEIGHMPALQTAGHHLVALALLPDMGNNMATAITTNLRHHFPSITHIVMCGIAGGIPCPGSATDHVYLGDIVVSDRGGVVQYDFIKESQTIESRHPPRAPSAELLHAARMLEAGELEGARPWEGFLPRADNLVKARRPAENAGANGESIEHPVDPMRRLGFPRVVKASIASSNTLLKNEIKRDALRVKFGTKAVEMEGSGLADGAWLADVGYFVVRGICDYCDDKKGDVWQDYAAVVAATYVRALLGRMASDD